jgi:predicted nuclease of predicted toxin-antitoxin system
MKLLFDQNISHRLVGLVRDILPDSKQVRNLGIENFTDAQIWNYAKENAFTIVTFDADFYDFSLIWGHPPKIVWIRTQNQTSPNIEVLLRKHLESIKDFIINDELACLEIINLN